ncbi:MAG: hypothetical protein ACI3ZC_09305 [Candidatus Cryptobacteroides sp.]
MKKFQEIRNRTERTATIIALSCTVAGHATVAVFGVFSGMTYIYPPPEEKSILVDFSQEDERVAVVQQKKGSRPQAENPDKTKPVELVQHSEAQEKGTKANEAPEATVDDFGDVEKYEPPREKEINRKALFHAPDNKTDKDTLAAQTARKVSDALKEGHAQGNTAVGKTNGEPNAVVKGRSVKGSIVKPEYTVQDAGIVVVSILVDQYGNVTKAQAGATGTTVNNAALWSAARKAALETHFNMDGNAPPLQEGTITYVFELKK